MPRRLNLPDTASVANACGGNRLSAPSAQRNREALCDLVDTYAPRTGRALEIASGTGEHVLAYAARLPRLDWQPSDIDAARRASIDAGAATSETGNLRPAIELDATAPGWSAGMARFDLVILSNLLHLISQKEVDTLLAEACAALAPHGRLIIYGPFQRAGEFTSSGDQQFDADLRAQDPDIGYKDDFETIDRILSAGLDLVDVVEMPANNLALIAART